MDASSAWGKSLGYVWSLRLPLAALLVTAGAAFWQDARPALAVDAKVVTGGISHTCVLTGAGGVKCWGSNAKGQIGDNLACGDTCSTPKDVTGLASSVTAIEAGGYHTCVLLTSEGRVKCWGDNANGQLGDGTTNQRNTPVDVCKTNYAGALPCQSNDRLSGVAAISAGFAHTCALMSSGSVLCWGTNFSGGLGAATTDTCGGPLSSCSKVPIAVTNSAGAYGAAPNPNADFAALFLRGAIATGAGYTCARTRNGGANCWGLNDKGQLGDGTTTSRTVPVNVCASGSGAGCATGGGARLMGVGVLTAGLDHTCAMTNPALGLKCWGNNVYGELGDRQQCGINQCARPVDVVGFTGEATASRALGVSAGGVHVCAITSTASVKCWGANLTGQLGDGSKTHRTEPVSVTGLGGSQIKSVGLGTDHSCAVTRAGNVKCWGYNSSGALGNGQTAEGEWATQPVTVTGMGAKTCAGGGSGEVAGTEDGDEGCAAVAGVSFEVEGRFGADRPGWFVWLLPTVATGTLAAAAGVWRMRRATQP